MFLKKKSENTYLIYLNVKPNSKYQKILENYEDNEYLTVLVRSKATQNKANKELINLLKNKLNISTNQIEMSSGIKSQRKIIRIVFNRQITEQEIIKCLFN